MSLLTSAPTNMDLSSWTTKVSIFNGRLSLMKMSRFFGSGTTTKLAAAWPSLTNSSSEARSTRTRRVTLPSMGGAGMRRMPSSRYPGCFFAGNTFRIHEDKFLIIAFVANLQSANVER